MTQKELNDRMAELSKDIAKAGFEKAQQSTPYFTNMLFVWAEKNGYTQALTEFIACFVEGAMTKSLVMLTEDMRSVQRQSERIARKEKKKVDMDKYLKAPWHESAKELPEHSGMRCMCYMPRFKCEVEMIFHRARKDSGYKDSFMECAKGNREYDYDFIKYWRYFNDKEDGGDE